MVDLENHLPKEAAMKEKKAKKKANPAPKKPSTVKKKAKTGVNKKASKPKVTPTRGSLAAVQRRKEQMALMKDPFKGTFNTHDIMHAPVEKTVKMLEKIISGERLFTM